MPLMLTGGFTRRETVEQVLADGVAVVAVGTALSVTPDLPRRWAAHVEADSALRPVTWSDKALASAASMALVRHQLRRLAAGRATAPLTRPAVALIAERLQRRKALRRYRS